MTQTRDQLAMLNPPTEVASQFLPELVAHLRSNRTHLREEWVRLITEAELLTAMSEDEILRATLTQKADA